MKKISTIIAIVLGLNTIAHSQNVSISQSGQTPDASAMLDVISNNRGLLIPRLSLTATNVSTPVTSPVTSLLVFNTSTAGSGSTAVTPGFYYWDGNISEWVRIIDLANLNTVINNFQTTLTNHINNDLDTVVGNEYNTNFFENNGTITITDGGGSLNVDINNTVAGQINDSLVTNVYPLISNNSNNINNNTSNISSNTTNISNNSNNITNLNNTLTNHINNDLDTVVGNEYNSNFVENNGTITITDGGGSLNVDINNTVAGQINDSLVTNVYPLISNNSNNINNNSNNINNNTSNISSNTTNISNNSNNITNLNNTLTNHINNDLDTLVGNEWTILGNSNTNSTSNFIGTTNNTDFNIRTNNLERIKVQNIGNIYANTSDETHQLQVGGTIGLGYGNISWANTAPNTPKLGIQISSSTSHISAPAFRIDNYDITNSNNNVNNRIFSIYSVNNPFNKYGLLTMGVFDGSNFNSGVDINGSGTATFQYVGGSSNPSQSKIVLLGDAGSDIAISDKSASPDKSMHFEVDLPSQIFDYEHMIGFNIQYRKAINSLNTTFGSNPTNDGGIALFAGAGTGTFGIAQVNPLGTGSAQLVTSNHIVFRLDNAGSVGLGTNSATTTNNELITVFDHTTMYSNISKSSGVTLLTGAGSWTVVSDKNKKTNFQDINYNDVLNKVSTLDIQKWSYKSQVSDSTNYGKDIYHIGVMAQDFYNAFGLDLNGEGVNTIDLSGVNMAAIKALLIRIKELEVKIKELESK